MSQRPQTYGGEHLSISNYLTFHILMAPRLCLTLSVSLADLTLSAPCR